MATLIAVTGDLHTGSTVALAPKKWVTDDGQVIYPSKVQRWLNERWAEFWAEAQRVKDERGIECVAILNGELADDNWHRTFQRMSENPGEIIDAAMQVLKPVKQTADRVYVTRGSPAHVGHSGGLDEALAKELDAIPDEYGRRARNVFRGEIDGYRLDAAHHPGTSTGRWHLRGNAANRLAVNVQGGYTDDGALFPHMAIRSHNHRPEDSYDNHKIRAVILPAWQLNMTDFGYRISSGSEPFPVGAMLMVVDKGELVWERKMFWRWPMLRRGWKKA